MPSLFLSSNDAAFLLGLTSAVARSTPIVPTDAADGLCVHLLHQPQLHSQHLQQPVALPTLVYPASSFSTSASSSRMKMPTMLGLSLLLPRGHSVGWPMATVAAASMVVAPPLRQATPEVVATQRDIRYARTSRRWLNRWDSNDAPYKPNLREGEPDLEEGDSTDANRMLESAGRRLS